MQSRLNLVAKWTCLVKMPGGLASLDKTEVSRFRGWGNSDAFPQEQASGALVSFSAWAVLSVERKTGRQAPKAQVKSAVCAYAAMCFTRRELEEKLHFRQNLGVFVDYCWPAFSAGLSLSCLQAYPEWLPISTHLQAPMVTVNSFAHS